jgi:hypothetical protein
LNPTITDLIHRYEAKLAMYRRGLLREDRQAFDDLFVAAYKHRVSESLSSHLLPFEVFLLSGWLEDHKALMKLRDMSHDVRRLRAEVENLRREQKKRDSAK